MLATRADWRERFRVCAAGARPKAEYSKLSRLPRFLVSSRSETKRVASGVKSPLAPLRKGGNVAPSRHSGLAFGDEKIVATTFLILKLKPPFLKGGWGILPAPQAARETSDFPTRAVRAGREEGSELEHHLECFVDARLSLVTQPRFGPMPVMEVKLIRVDDAAKVKHQ